MLIINYLTLNIFVIFHVQINNLTFGVLTDHIER
nr:hypothetical protein [Mucilaginibacter sp. E4BP6]